MKKSRVLISLTLALVASLSFLPACSQNSDAIRSGSASNNWQELLKIIPENEYTAKSTVLQTQDYVDLLKEENPDATTGTDLTYLKLLVNNKLPLFQSTHYTDEEWNNTLGFSVNDITDSIASSSGPPRYYQAMRGDFTQQDIVNAVKAGPLNEYLETIPYKGYNIYSWGGDFDIHLDWRSNLRPLGRGHRLAYVDGYALWALWTDGIEQMIDAYKGDIPSLADNADYQLLASVLEKENTVAAFFSSTPLSYADAKEQFKSMFDDAIAAGNTDLVDAFDSGPFLKPFSALATGPGKDAQGTYMVIVLANADESTANQNADLLKQRINETDMNFPLAPRSGEKWTDDGRITSMDITAQGRLTVAKLYGRVYSAWDNFDLVTGAYLPLLIHE